MNPGFERTDQDPCAVLYTQHAQRILRLCRLLLVDSSEAEEVTQEVFEKLLLHLRTKNDVQSWEAWLTTIAVNACRDRRRSRWWQWWRRERVELQDDSRASEQPTPEQQVVTHEQQRRLWTRLQQLSTRQREVFILRRVEGLSNDAVAQLLGITSGSVKRHLYHALQHLQKVLGEP